MPTRLSRSMVQCSKLLRLAIASWWGMTAPRPPSSNPRYATPVSLARSAFGHAPVRSPLLGGRSYFLWVLRCFSSPGSLRPKAGHHRGDGVAPFGDTRITACSRLPSSYRSVATSFVGTQRRGIHRLRIMSSLTSHQRGSAPRVCWPREGTKTSILATFGW